MKELRQRRRSTSLVAGGSVVFLVLILIACCFVVDETQATKVKFLVRGGGASFPQPIYSEWAYAYSYLISETQITYTASSSGVGITALQAGSINFAGSDFPQNATFFKTNKGFKQYPFIAGAVVNYYNIQEIANETLYLSMPLLARIFSQKVTSWRDKEILDENPHLRKLLPDEDIKLVVRSSSSGTTDIFSTALSYYSPEWNATFSSFTTWPQLKMTYPERVTYSDGNFAIFADVRATPYSINYISYPFLIENQVDTFVRILKSDNVKDLHSTEPDDPGIYKAIDKARLDKLNAAALVPLASEVYSAWPIVGFSYLELNNNYDDCKQAREMFKWFRWTLVDENARERAEKKGYVPISPSLAQNVLRQLEQVTCDGKALLAKEVIDRHEKGYYNPLLIISIILMSIILLPGLYILFKSRSNTLSVVYYSLIILGCIVAYLSVIFFYLEPSVDWVCQLRQWLTALGFTILLGAIFTRTLQIHRIHILDLNNQLQSTPMEKIYKGGLYAFAACLPVILGIQIVILLIWSLTDKLSATYSVRDELNLTVAWVCKCNHIWLWIGLEISLFAVILFSSSFIIYKTWSFKAQFFEGRWILISIYNLSVTMGAFIPLYITIKIDDDKLFIMAVTAINFAIISTLALLYIQRIIPLLEVFRKSVSEASSSKDSYLS